MFAKICANLKRFCLQAKYLESDFYLGYISQAKSHSNQYIQTKIVTDKYGAVWVTWIEQ